MNLRKVAAVIALTLTLCGIAIEPASAAIYNWNGGTGDWDTTTTNWNGAGTTWPAISTGDDDAVFGAAAGTVSLTVPISANDITFNITGYTVQSNTNPDTLTLDGATPTITVSSTVNATINSIVDGSAGLFSTGAGNLTLGGTASNTYTGTTVVDGGGGISGVLTLNKTGGAVAINGPVQMGAVNGNQPNLRMNQSNQFASGVVMTFVNAPGSWTRFDLQGTAQTLAGIQNTTGGGVIQNERFGGGGTSAPGTLTIDNAADFSYNGYLRDEDDAGNVFPLALTKNGVGTQTLSGGNIYYTGTTTVNAGTLRLTSTTGFASDVTLAGGTLDFNQTAGSLSFVRTLSGVSGTVSKTGGGEVVLGGATSNTFAGTTIVDNGVLSLGKTGGAVAISGPLQMGGVNGNQPHLRMNQSNQFASGVVMTFVNAFGSFTRFDLQGTSQTLAGLQGTTGGGVIQNERLGGGGTSAPGTLTIDNAADYSYNGYLRDEDDGGNVFPLSLVKSGNGTQTLSGGNINYTGTTTVNSGTLKLSQTNVFNSAVTIATGAVLEMNTIANLGNAAAPSFTGTGTLRKTGNFQWYLDAGGTNIADLNMSPGGLIDIQEGSIYQGGTPTRKLTTNQGNLNVATGATFDLYADNAQADALTGSGTVQNTYGPAGVKTFTVGVANGSGTFTGTIGGGGLLALTKAGTGTQTLAGANFNNYTGGTTVSAGTLKLDLTSKAGATPLGAISVGANGTLELYNTNAIVDNVLVTGNSNITGSGTVTKTGPGYVGLWSDSDTIKDFTGLVDVQEGTLGSNGNGWENSAGLMDLNVAASAAFDMRTQNVVIDQLTGAGTIYSSFSAPTLIVGNNNGTASFSGTITNGLGFSKNGSGTQTLSGSNINYTGATAVNQGSLVLVQTSSFRSSITTAAGAVTEWQQTANLNYGWITNDIYIQGAGRFNKTGAFNMYLDQGAGQQFMVQQSAGGVFDLQAGLVQQGGTPNSGFRGTNLGSLNVATGATLDLFSSDATVDALTGGGSILNDWVPTGIKTLTVGVANHTSSISNPFFAGSTSTFSGTISNGAAGVALVKTGTGTQILSGSNSYSGGTSITGGALLVTNTTGSGVGTGNVLINGGTLGGTGIVGLASDAANVSFGTSGGKIAPGTSSGILTVNGDVNFNTGAGTRTFEVELSGNTAGTDYDQLLVNSATGGTDLVDLTGATLNALFSGSGWGGSSSRLWIVNNQTSGTLLGVFANYPVNGQLVTVHDGHSWSIIYGADLATNSLTGGNDVVLIPEPGTVVMALFGTVGIGLMRRRRTPS